MKKILCFTTCLALAFCSFMLADIYSTQEREIFKAKTLPQDFVFDSRYSHPFQEVYLRTDKDATIHGLHFKAKNAKGAVLYFHGRGWNLGSKKRKGLPEDFVNRGYDVFAIDYRTFGKSTGPLSEEAILSDANYAYDYLRQHYPEKQITVYGMSFGTGPATYVAARHNPRQLILECPYFSMIDMADKATPYLPSFITSWIVKYHVRTDQFIQNVTCPIHIFHGKKDAMIPHDSSMRLMQRVKSRVRAQLISIEEGDHDHLPACREYTRQLDKLLH